MRRSRISSWIGRHRFIDGQIFEVVAIERVRFHRGFAPVLRWRSTCASCGEAFEFRTCRRPPNAYFERRCRSHAVKPGRVLRRHLHLGSGTPGVLDVPLYEDRMGNAFAYGGALVRCRGRPELEA